MNDEQKNKARDAYGKLTGWLEGLGVPAKWAKVGAGVAIGAIIGALATCVPSCTPGAVHQAGLVHELYHSVTGKPCVLRVEVVEAGK